MSKYLIALDEDQATLVMDAICIASMRSAEDGNKEKWQEYIKVAAVIKKFLDRVDYE